MNSATLPPLSTAGFKIGRQAIVDRSHTLWGREFSVACQDNRQQLEHAYSAALQRISPRRKILHTQHAALRHTFLRIDQAALMNDDVHQQIVQLAQVMERQKRRLTLSIDNPLDGLPGPQERRAMVRQLYSLKDQSCITLAYNNYTFDTKRADLLIDLKLYDYIKMPFPDSAIRLSANTRSDLFDRLYDRMLELIHASRVCFIADNVEFADSAMLAKNLPFEYFQGGYYSPADCL